MKIPYYEPALLKISIPNSNIDNIMMAAEEGIIQLDIEGVKTQFKGTPINERLQAFIQGADSVSILFDELNKEIDLKIKEGQSIASLREESRQKRTQLIIENTDRIVAFIKENIDNPVGEYYFRKHYITFILERKLELNSFASEKLKKEFGIQ